MILTVDVDGDVSASDDEAADLLSDISTICPSGMQAGRATEHKHVAPNTDVTSKGDPITAGAILLAAVASGGVLAKAFSPGGFFTKLADLLHERMKKGVRVRITTSDGSKVELTGTSKEIESLLKKHFRKESHG